MVDMPAAIWCGWVNLENILSVVRGVRRVERAERQDKHLATIVLHGCLALDFLSAREQHTSTMFKPLSF